MPRLFAVGEQIHHADDPRCPTCAEGYPEPCVCDGLMHATEAEATANDDLALMPVTQCDRCGRSKEEREEAA
jgi:hypothetical protein